MCISICIYIYIHTYVYIYIYMYVFIYAGGFFTVQQNAQFLRDNILLRCAHMGWGGVGWGNNVQLHLHTHVMLRFCTFFSMLRCAQMGWGGVGWGNNVQLHLHTHTSCSASARSSHCCTHTRTSCYTSARSSHCCTHTSCYASARSLNVAHCKHTSWYAFACFFHCSTNTRHATQRNWWKIQSPTVFPQPRGRWRWIKNLSLYSIFPMAMGNQRDSLKTTARYIKQLSWLWRHEAHKKVKPSLSKTLFSTPKLTYRCGETVILSLKCRRWKFRRDIYLSMYIYVCMYIYIFKCMYVKMHMNRYMYIYMYVYVYM